MKKRLSIKENIIVASMLFGLFFGAGNLIFPIHMGQLAGSNVVPALIGFILTGVGLPILGVAALGKSHSDGLYEMATCIGKKYSMFFTCLLYLTIGPFFAIPRCATTAFSVGFRSESRMGLLIFSALFFVIVLLFSLRPGRIMDWIGKYLNPVFLLFFGSLIVIVLIKPTAAISSVVPDVSYSSGALFNGFLEGYNTMDALAGLAFGIIVVNSIKKLGVKEPENIAAESVKSGILCAILMVLIYTGACLVGATSRGAFPISENGGIALAQISEYYFGGAGMIFLVITVTLACLKTAIGLITSISETFSKMFTKSRHYKAWAIGFCLFAFAISNVGLNSIIKISIPVLMFLYPLTITIIALSLCSSFFGNDRRVYVSVTAFTAAAAFLDFLKGMGIMVFDSLAGQYLPFYQLGLGWVVPAIIGLVLGMILHIVNKTGNKDIANC